MTKYIIPAILAFCGGLLLWIIKRDKVSMEYEVIESEIFPRDTGNGKYFVIKINNGGNKPVADTALKLVFNSGEIESVNFSNEDLLKDVDKDNCQVKAIIPLLNPKEHLSITITTINADANTKPVVQARAVGVTAVEKKKGEALSTYAMNILSAIAVGVAITALFSAWNSYKQINTVKTIDEIKNELVIVGKKSADIEESIQQRKLDDPKTEQIVFAILNKAGIGYVFPDLVCSGGQIEYWRTGIFLMHSFLIDQQNAEKYISAMTQLVEIEEYSASSKGFNLYLLAKMYHFIGNSEKAITYMELCKNQTPSMYEYLINQDPAYDLVKIQTHLKQKE